MVVNVKDLPPPDLHSSKTFTACQEGSKLTVMSRARNPLSQSQIPWAPWHWWRDTGHAHPGVYIRSAVIGYWEGLLWSEVDPVPM